MSMDVPSALILVSRRDLSLLDHFVSSWAMDAVEVEVYGSYGFGFFDQNEANRVIEFLREGPVEFKMFEEGEPQPPNPPPPPPSPERQTEQREPPEGEAASV